MPPPAPEAAPLSAAEEEMIIKKRLQTQTTIARQNADPPLKKVAKRFAPPRLRARLLAYGTR